MRVCVVDKHSSQHITMYSFMQLSELEQRRVNELAIVRHEIT